MSGGVTRGGRIAGHLIDIGAISLSPDKPFTWTSGLRSPIYCDNRATLAHPRIRREITGALADLILETESPLDAVIGVATGAIAHAAFVAERLELPMGYIRSSPKGHGRRNRIEGFVQEGARVVVIEDLISTGGSSLSAVEGVRSAGMDVACTVAIFSYGFPSVHRAFEEAGLALKTLVDFSELLSVARSRTLLDDAGERVLQQWRSDPEAWSDRWELKE